jgi:hypothetical protein
MTRHGSIALLAWLSIVSLACDYRSPVTESSGISTGDTSSFVGRWTAAGATPNPLAGACRDVVLNITSQTSTSISGTFTATCLVQDVPVTGSATGTLTSPTAGTVTVSGSGVVPGTGDCTFSIAGAGTVAPDAVNISYQGSSCLGPFSGNVVLQKGDVPGVL